MVMNTSQAGGGINPAQVLSSDVSILDPPGNYPFCYYVCHEFCRPPHGGCYRWCYLHCM